MSDTIFALSSGAPPAAIAIVRVSGPGAFAAARTLAGTLPAPRTAGLRALRDPAEATLLDRALVLCFPGAASATGEDLVEFHLHGGLAVVRAVETAIGAIAGCRQAEAGEFTRRALENGRIDLTEAEGLADLLAADSERQRRAALLGAEGGLRRRIEDWTDRTVTIAAMLEAAIDHSDEEDAHDEAAIVAAVRDGARLLADEIAGLLEQPPVERLRDGIRVVLAGPPNSGKSTLLNALTGRDAAIVSPVAGTTRDRIEAPVMRRGIAWLFIDTAGLARHTSDPIEAIGIARSRDSMATADIVIWMGDGPPPVIDAIVLLAHARSDQADRTTVAHGRLPVSGVSAHGQDPLWSALDAAARRLLPPDDVPLLNERHRRLCRVAAMACCSAAAESDLVVMAEHLREAGGAFDSITGRADTEAVLDALFSRFCIGK